MEAGSVQYLNLPDEIIIVDDDVNEMEISYLPRLLDRFDNIDRIDIRTQNIAVNETFDLVSTDDSEDNEKVKDFISFCCCCFVNKIFTFKFSD